MVISIRRQKTQNNCLPCRFKISHIPKLCLWEDLCDQGWCTLIEATFQLDKTRRISLLISALTEIRVGLIILFIYSYFYNNQIKRKVLVKLHAGGFFQFYIVPRLPKIWVTVNSLHLDGVMVLDPAISPPQSSFPRPVIVARCFAQVFKFYI